MVIDLVLTGRGHNALKANLPNCDRNWIQCTLSPRPTSRISPATLHVEEKAPLTMRNHEKHMPKQRDICMRRVSGDGKQHCAAKFWTQTGHGTLEAGEEEENL